MRVVSAYAKEVHKALKTQLFHIKSFTLPNAVHLYMTEDAIYLQTRSSVICTTKIPAQSSESLSEPLELVIKLKSTLDVLENLQGDVELSVGVSGLVVKKENLSVRFPSADMRVSRYVEGEYSSKTSEASDYLREAIGLCLGTKVVAKLLAKSINYSIGQKLAQVRYPNVFFQFHCGSSVELYGGEALFQFLYKVIPAGEKMSIERSEGFTSLRLGNLKLVLGDMTADIVDLNGYVSGSIEMAKVNMTEVIRIVVKMAKSLKKCNVMFSFPNKESCRAEIQDDGCNIVTFVGSKEESNQSVRFTLPIELASTILNSFTTAHVSLRQGRGHYIFATEGFLIIFTSS